MRTPVLTPENSTDVMMTIDRYTLANTLRFPITGPTTNTARYEVKPEAATAVIELLMMGGKTPETC
jgi:inosine-uridine nucleoside N-ribohydrolase